MVHAIISYLVLAALLISARLYAQDPLPNEPDWLYADSTLVQHPSWISGTVAKNIVIVTFHHGTPPGRRIAVIQQVHGNVVYHDRVDGEDGAYYLRVPSHPDACGVKQALEVLDQVPEVEMAVPHLVFSGGPDGAMSDFPTTHKGSKRPCPPGTGLLK